MRTIIFREHKADEEVSEHFFSGMPTTYVLSFLKTVIPLIKA